MTDTSHSVSQWIAGLKEGEKDAAQQLWTRYWDDLVKLARKHLHGVRRRELDEEDVAQDVFFSLCRGASAGKFSRLSSRDDLWSLLIKITRNKAVDEFRRQNRQVRGAGRVRGHSVLVSAGSSADKGFQDIVAQPADQETLVALKEMDELIRQDLREEDTSGVVEKVYLLIRDGLTHQEIADRLDCSTKTVQRKLELRVRPILEKYLPAEMN